MTGTLWKRLQDKALSAVEESINADGYSFMHSDHLDFIGTCPSNLGTGLHVSMLVKLEKLGTDPHALRRCVLRLVYSLVALAKSTSGEHSAAVGDISNKGRIGKSDMKLVQTMVDGYGTGEEAGEARDTKRYWRL